MYVSGTAETVDPPRASSIDDAPSLARAEAETAVVLVADDFGLTPAIGVAIRRLIDMGRLSATSCLVTSPHWPGEAARLRPVAETIDIGLHFNLTLGRPLGAMPKLAADGRFPPLERLISRALMRRLDVDEIAGELDRQIDRFAAEFGRLPDFVDGHEHVHVLPVVRRAVIRVMVRRLAAAGAWVRDPAMRLADILRSPESAPAAIAISCLAFGFRRLARRHGIAGNPVFRGVRRFSEEPPYPQLFDYYLTDVQPGTLIVCHPGVHEDEIGPSRHPSAAREEEYAYLASDVFAARLRRGHIRLARLRDIPLAMA